MQAQLRGKMVRQVNWKRKLRMPRGQVLVLGERHSRGHPAWSAAHPERQHSSCLPERQSGHRWWGDQANHVPSIHWWNDGPNRGGPQREESGHAVSGQRQDHQTVGRPHSGADRSTAHDILRKGAEVRAHVGHRWPWLRLDRPLCPWVQWRCLHFTHVPGP